MEKQLKSIFSQCPDRYCLQGTESDVFGVSEQENGVCQLVDSGNDMDFKVENKTKKTVNFLAIDHCIWDDGCGHKKCDFALFNHNQFSFIELKCKVKMRNWRAERRDAAEKFRDTLDQFKNKKIDFSKHKLELYIAFGNRPYSTGASTRSQALMDEFNTNYNAALLEGNYKIFK